MQVQFLVWKDPRGKKMATHSSILAWEILSMESLVGDSPLGGKKSRLSLELAAKQNIYRLYGLEFACF